MSTCANRRMTDAELKAKVKSLEAKVKDLTAKLNGSAAAASDDTQPPPKKRKRVSSVRAEFDKAAQSIECGMAVPVTCRFRGLGLDDIAKVESMSPSEFAKWVELEYPRRSTSSLARKWNDASSLKVHLKLYCYDGVITETVVDHTYTVSQLVTSLSFIPVADLSLVVTSTRKQLNEKDCPPNTPLSNFCCKQNKLSLYVGASQPHERNPDVKRAWYTLCESKESKGVPFGVIPGITLCDLYVILTAAIGKPFECADIPPDRFIRVTSNWIASHQSPSFYFSYPAVSNKRPRE